ncbi:lytic transglycosylase domain-containing protein [Novosphingobium sp.]|uniref:lytic transglycosylase domain-containing protein n=1 Tax=Novosphingobium sp. TaxID=1874826 RepID=UPI0038B6C25B
MLRIFTIGAGLAFGLLTFHAHAREVSLETFPNIADPDFAIRAGRSSKIREAPQSVTAPGIPAPENEPIGLPGPPPIAPPYPCQTTRMPPQPGLSTLAQMRRTVLYPVIALAACAEGVPPALLDALIARESRYNPAAISRKGAIGLTQLMPATAAALGAGNPWSTYANLKGGARYLRQQLDAFGRYDLALAAYNAGPGNVRRHKGVPPFAETRDYVEDVLATLLRGRPLAMPMPKSSGRSVFLAVYPASVSLPRMTAP